MSSESYLATCWNCLGEFDAVGAVWCSHDPKNPTKLCPFCFRCFCDASEQYKAEFWRRAPEPLRDELATLQQSKDRLGDVLIRMKKLTTPQLLDALTAQRDGAGRLGELLIERGLVTPDDVAAALRTQGVSPLTDTLGVAYAATPVWERSSPDAIIQYLVNLAARKGASDVQIEPRQEDVAVRYRIDGFFFRVDPIPKEYQDGLTRRLLETFGLRADRIDRPQRGRISTRIGDADYDLILQTVPTRHGAGASVKLVRSAEFVKDLASLGIEIEDRVRLLEEMRSSFGLVLLSAPMFEGAATTAYALMQFLVRGQRDVLSLESPVYWHMDGVRQVEVEPEGPGSGMAATLRSVIAARPQVVMLSAVPDPATALLAVQLAASVLVVCVVPAQTAGQAVQTLTHLGVAPSQLGSVLVAATCQRLVRLICRICRRPVETPAPNTLAHHGIGPDEATGLAFSAGAGCPTCNRVGYRGRRAIFEVATGVPEVRAAVHNDLAATEVEAVAVQAGMTPLRRRCLDLVREGVTTFDEFVRLRL